MCSNSTETDDSTLQLVHVIFRHGDRTPEASYPLDPYKDEDYFPYGMGGLTHKGKLRIYELGKELKRRYGDFLGDTYAPDLLEVRATDYDRTKMSALLCTAGLFPPHDPIPWQPIPYHYEEKSKDQLMGVAFRNSPTFIQIYREFLLSEEGQLIIKPYRSLLNFLIEKTGRITENFIAVALDSDTVLTQIELGFEPPDWFNTSLTTEINSLITTLMQTLTETEILKQLSGGALLKKILADSQAKFDAILNPAQRKMFLYSAHDFTIFAVMRAMNFNLDNRPLYGAHLIIELHKIDNEPYVKVIYQDGSENDAAVCCMENFTEFCPLSEFVSSVSKNFPKDSRL